MICQISIVDDQLKITFGEPVGKDLQKRILSILKDRFQEGIKRLVTSKSQTVRVNVQDTGLIDFTAENFSFKLFNDFVEVIDSISGENNNIKYSDIADSDSVTTFFDLVQLCSFYGEDYQTWIINYVNRMEKEKIYSANQNGDGLHSTFNVADIQDYKPTRQITPYEKLSKCFFDIETTGLDPEKDKIILIGVMDETEQTEIFEGYEKDILINFNSYLNDKKPDILAGHNVFNFDIKFIYKRCQQYGLQPQFEPGYNAKLNSTSFHGQPIEVQIFNSKIPKINVVDSWILTAQYDFSARKLRSYNLKNTVIDLGLRDDRRLELSGQEIQECYNTGDIETVKEYLKYDLEDTKLLTDYLLPNYHYQQLFIPKASLQQICLMGNASKWERIIEQHYQTKPLADEKINYEGGLNYANPGFYRNCAKMDISSLYPSIMLNYRICSKKDTKQVSLQILKYLTTERLRLKKLAKQGDKQADHKQASMKILINSLYGFLGTQGIPFNDFQAAAKVTEIGRNILQLMIDIIRQQGGVVVEADTDGIIYSSEKPDDILTSVQSELPEGINVEYEFEKASVFVKKKKNYIVLYDNGDVTLKGRFANRDRLELEKEFFISYLKEYIKSPDKADHYFNKILNDIRTNRIDKSKITVNRIIRKGEKKLVNAGIGEPGDRVSFYIGIGEQPTASGNYDPVYYINMISKIKREIDGVINTEDNRTTEHFTGTPF